ncbi:MAG: nitroreductase family protein [Deltaproteobacteria bacterium]|jgi:hypothetical protein|nr:nitroreductase family protein [Deltaproteobacteria bacterium]
MKPLVILALALALSLCPTLTKPLSAAGGDIALPPPGKTGGMPLMEALSKRKSYRELRPETLTLQQISDILWAAFGVNREDGKRTIPSSHGNNELAVYAVLSSGVYLYDAPGNKLVKVLDGDRSASFRGAPLTLLYAAPANGPVGGFHAGSAYQNVALYCASSGLANLVATSGVAALKDELKPENGWAVLVVHSIGHPAGKDF